MDLSFGRVPKEKEDSVEEERTRRLFSMTALSKILEKRFPGWGESMKGKRTWYQSLTARIYLLVLFAILVTSTGVAFYFVMEEKGHKEKDLVEHGTSLASMLAQYAGHGIATEDENMLISLLIGTDANPDIAWARCPSRESATSNIPEPAGWSPIRRFPCPCPKHPGRGPRRAFFPRFRTAGDPRICSTGPEPGRPHG
jgi:hypothetical protein